MAKKKTVGAILEGKLEENASSEIEVLGIPVTVDRYISYENLQRFIANYLSILYGENSRNLFPQYISRNRFMAELYLRQDVLVHMTSMDFDKDEDGRVYVPEIVLLSDKIYIAVIDEIENYCWFRNILKTLTRDVEEEQRLANSAGAVIEKLLGEVESSEDNLKKMAESVRQLGKQVEESKLSGLMDEAKKG